MDRRVAESMPMASLNLLIFISLGAVLGHRIQRWRGTAELDAQLVLRHSFEAAVAKILKALGSKPGQAFS